MSAEISTSMLASLAHVTERQVDHWCRLGRLVPARIESGWPGPHGPGSGSRRKFDRSHVKVAVVLGDIMRLTGGSRLATKDVEKVAAELEQRRTESWSGEWITVLVSQHSSIMVDLESAERAADEALRGVRLFEGVFR